MVAWEAAFADPRLPRLTTDEYERAVIEVSRLSPLAPIDASSYAEFVDALAPGVDGVFVVATPYRATFLPAVWTKLPEPRLFAGLLWNKAGLPAGYWPPDIAVYRYGTERFGRPAGQRTSPE